MAWQTVSRSTLAYSSLLTQRNRSPHCIKGLTFRPDAEYLQLPSNQTLVSSFPGAMSRAVALNHLATALMGLAIVFMFFCLKPDEGWPYVGSF